jgi:hypothetical protein
MLALTSMRATYCTAWRSRMHTRLGRSLTAGCRSREAASRECTPEHNILEMVRSSGIALNEEEVDILKTVTFSTKSMGKYPIALSAEKQKEFTGRTYGATFVAPLSRRIILELLKESPYTDIFLVGQHSGVDDTG